MRICYSRALCCARCRQTITHMQDVKPSLPFTRWNHFHVSHTAFSNLSCSECMLRRDQTGWFIQVSNRALLLNTKSSIISVISPAIWEISCLSFSSILEGCRNIHTHKSAGRQWGGDGACLRVTKSTKQIGSDQQVATHHHAAFYVLARMEVEGRMSCSGDYGPRLLIRAKVFLRWSTSHFTCSDKKYQWWTHQSWVLRQNCTLWSLPKWLSDESSADWDIQHIKKCRDWKPGKLMSLHFYLLNLYRLLCQGLWGFSVPSLVIVFSLFAWESDTVLWNLGESISKLFHMGKTRRPGKSLRIMDTAAAKLRWQSLCVCV